MTGDTLPRGVKPVFHEFCDCCKYLELKTTEMSFTSDYHDWKEYTISCEHYGACERAYGACERAYSMILPEEEG